MQAFLRLLRRGEVTGVETLHRTPLSYHSLGQFLCSATEEEEKSSGKGFFHFSSSVSLPFEACSLQPAEDSMDLLALLNKGCTAACCQRLKMLVSGLWAFSIWEASMRELQAIIVCQLSQFLQKNSVKNQIVLKIEKHMNVNNLGPP